jgi:hypothetical protein
MDRERHEASLSSLPVNDRRSPIPPSVAAQAGRRRRSRWCHPKGAGARRGLVFITTATMDPKQPGQPMCDPAAVLCSR